MIRGAIFDVDGTLLDSMAIWKDAGARYLKGLGIQAQEDLGKLLFPMSLQEGAAYMKARYDLKLSVSQIIEGVGDTVRDYYFYEAPLKKGAADFLEKLSKKDIPMAVATSSELEHIEAAFKRLNVNQYFQKIFTCSQVGAGKSRPDIYLAASRHLETEPRETYVFEDVLHAIKTADNAGFKTVGVYDRFSESKQEEIRKHSDIYLEDLTNFQTFWEYASR